jgi:hypothetical protein
MVMVGPVSAYIGKAPKVTEKDRPERAKSLAKWTLQFQTMMVMMIAMTPSEQALSLPLCICCPTS